MEKVSQIKQKLSDQSKQYQAELISEMSASIELILKESEKNLTEQSTITLNTIESVTKTIGRYSDKTKNPTLFQYLEYIAKQIKKEESIFQISILGYTLKITKE